MRSVPLLDHIEPTSILATQLRSEGEAILLRERVLRDAVAEKNELIHRRGRVGDFVAWGSVYLLLVGDLNMGESSRSSSRIPPSSGPTLHLSSGDTGDSR